MSLDRSTKKLLNQLTNLDEDTQSTFKEQRVVGKNLQEASSTTHPPNSRFVVIQNGNVLNEDDRDNLLTHKKPLYEFTVQPGEEVIVQGRERNAYVPGTGYVSRSTTEIEDTGPDGNFLPNGVNIETGYADLSENAGFGPRLPKNGVVLEMKPRDVIFKNYKDDDTTVSKSVTGGEWLTDIFDEDIANYSFDKFSVKGVEGTLYGAGTQKLKMLFRDSETSETYEHVATIGDTKDPISNAFNLFVTAAKVTVDEDADPFTIRTGPLNFFNDTEEMPSDRNKEAAYSDLNVTEALGADNFTIIKIYRIDPDNVEAPLRISRVKARSDTTSGRIEVREVHPDWIDFGTFDETNPDNWEAPPNQRPKETALLEAQIDEGVATLETDSNGRRGFQKVTDEFTTDAGFFSVQNTPADVTTSIRLNEFYYIVIGAQLADTGGQIDRLRVFDNQGW